MNLVTSGRAGVFGDKNVGTGKTVTVSGYTITGADAANYSFAGYITPSANYTVSKRALTGSIARGTSIYGNTLAPGAASFTNAIAGDVLGSATRAVATAGRAAIRSVGAASQGGNDGEPGTPLRGRNAVVAILLSRVEEPLGQRHTEKEMRADN